jgi:catechol 2,3-dioxygenase-like lactoylglutathione lyase family enzyme
VIVSPVTGLGVKEMKKVILVLVLLLFADNASRSAAPPASGEPSGKKNVRLGNFSVSLAVKNLADSREFYEKLGFHVVGGNGRNFSILQNETATIGLFQGMFKQNILTFNPGWDRTTATLPDFDDVRDIQRTLTSRGITLATKADETTTGPASIICIDPDGNQILIDQHVPSPRKAG